MKIVALSFAVLCAGASVCARAQGRPVLLQLAPAEPNQVENGFVTEIDVGTQLIDVANGSLASLSGNCFVGVKIDRLIIGGAFYVGRVHQDPGGGQPETSSTQFLFVPGIRLTAVRSRDARVEVFVELDVGLGHGFVEPVDTNNVLLRYVVGPGLRYWIHPRFAFTAVAGMAGALTWTNGPWTLEDLSL